MTEKSLGTLVLLNVEIDTCGNKTPPFIKRLSCNIPSAGPAGKLSNQPFIVPDHLPERLLREHGFVLKREEQEVEGANGVKTKRLVKRWEMKFDDGKTRPLISPRTALDQVRSSFID